MRLHCLWGRLLSVPSSVSLINVKPTQLLLSESLNLVINYKVTAVGRFVGMGLCERCLYKKFMTGGQCFWCCTCNKGLQTDSKCCVPPFIAHRLLKHTLVQAAKWCWIIRPMCFKQLNSVLMHQPSSFWATETFLYRQQITHFLTEALNLFHSYQQPISKLYRIRAKCE